LQGPNAWVYGLFLLGLVAVGAGGLWLARRRAASPLPAPAES
jgi:LPXTG-motif cell wall-anchored protein